MSGHVGICRANVGTTLGLSWLILSHFGPHWDHIGPMMSHFGLCAGLYLVKNTVNAQKKRLFLAALLMFLMPCWTIFFPFFWGMLRLGYAGLISSSCWAKIRSMLGCCCVLLSPCWADVEPLCLGTAFVSCAVWVVVVSWLRMVSLRRVNNVLGVYWCCVTCHLVVPWWSVGDVLVQTSRPISLYCAGASWWRWAGMHS